MCFVMAPPSLALHGSPLSSNSHRLGLAFNTPLPVPSLAPAALFITSPWLPEWTGLCSRGPFLYLDGPPLLKHASLQAE